MNEIFFRGWYVVIAAHLLLALIFGAAYSFGAFFGQLQSSFGVGRFSVASIFSLTAFIYYAVGVFAGSIADRTSTRKVVGAGVVLLALGALMLVWTAALYRETHPRERRAARPAGLRAVFAPYRTLLGDLGFHLYA
ncbi:hypothetical protein OIV41_33070, partial [Burkholderia pseudomallei]|nr:hypothetical protein [Burkholderia pseudomallei]